jgi:acetyl esterase
MASHPGVAARVRLEPAADTFAEAANERPFPFELGIFEGRKALDELQATASDRPDAKVSYLTVPWGPGGRLLRSGNGSVRVVRPAAAAGALPAIVYLHGGGWVFGDHMTHNRLTRELAAGAGAAVVFVNYILSPEVRYPFAIEEAYAVLEWVAGGGVRELDTARVAVAGDSVGATMCAALTLLARERLGSRLAAQALFYPATDAGFDTPSYLEFAEGYHLRRDTMQWFWDQYAPEVALRREITASPLRASGQELANLPPALVITAEADVLRDEGEAYAAKLSRAGVPVTVTRYDGIIHDFMTLDALRNTRAAGAAISQAIAFLKEALGA